MKKNVVLLTLISSLVFLYSQTVYAQTSPSVTPRVTTAVPSPQTSQIDQQINNLQEKIASQVAQLNLVSKRGWIGTVTETTSSEITITDVQNNTRFVDVDELTKFSSPDAKGTFGMSDITKGTTIGALGLYNKDSKKLLARFVDVLSLPQILSGEVISVDKANYLLHIATPDKKDIPVDIETFTKTYSYNQTDGMKKSGFSKIEINQKIFIVGSYNIHNASHILASRIIHFSDIAPDPRITNVIPTVTITDTIIPSTGSGRKLVPIIRSKQ